MDMQLDSQRIRAERERRAWSQEHLAAAAGVALRTIQRVEAAGAGSYETVEALASVFEVDVAELRKKSGRPPPTFTRRARVWSAVASVVAVMALLFAARQAVAGQVQLDWRITLDDSHPSKGQLITVEGKDAEIRLEKQVRLVLAPTINADGAISLAMQVFEYDGNGFVLLSTPRMFVADNTQGAVHLTTSRGVVIRIAITPHKV